MHKNTNPPQVGVYLKAIKVTVDGPREPRSKIRHQQHLRAFATAFGHQRQPFLESRGCSLPSISTNEWRLAAHAAAMARLPTSASGQDLSTGLHIPSACAGTDTWGTASAAYAHYTATAAYYMSGQSNCVDLHQNPLIDSQSLVHNTSASYLMDSNGQSGDGRPTACSSASHPIHENNGSPTIHSSGRVSGLTSKCDVISGGLNGTDMIAHHSSCKSDSSQTLSAFTAPIYQSTGNNGSSAYLSSNSYPLLNHGYYGTTCSASAPASSANSSNLMPSLLYPSIYSSNPSLQGLFTNRTNNCDNLITDTHIYGYNNSINSLNNPLSNTSFDANNSCGNNSETVSVWRPY
ncbi:unnamed protein product [Oppiella nova]|uniref:Runt domain-containing protein n=1 Tax=Oppiella nova TaxID=334625 RepID=A0A7R9MCG3_9ACAR|nr:unnamed protein product [Oppiella nova]CAG2173770.1 unnamed protein product [Oppiella nova]